jgi:aarF domain-containing kinase
LRYTIYGKTGVFDAERFIDVMQAFENFIRAAKSGGGENLKGSMAELAEIGTLPSTSLVPAFPMAISQPEQPVKARAALSFLLSERGDFFREFILDEIVKAIDAVSREQLIQIAASFGLGNATPVFSMVPVRARALLPTITEEDRVILNNVEKVVKFLTAGNNPTTIDGVCILNETLRKSNI